MSDIKYVLDEELAHIVSDDSKFSDIIKRAGCDTEKVSYGKRKAGKKILKTALIAASIIILSVGSVFGYEHFSRNYKSPQVFDDHMGQADTDAPVYDMAEGTEVNKASDIVAEWNKYTLNEHTVIFNLTLKSSDGSPIMEETENKVPMAACTTFEKIYITIDGNTYTKDSAVIISQYGNSGASCRVFCLNLADDLSSASFEIEFTDYDLELSGKNITVRLENLYCDYYIFEDIGVQKTLGELITDGVEALPQDFVESEDGQYYNLKPGKNKIYFTEQFPECYIDNYGFIGRRRDGTKAFFMTVVCDAASRDAIKNLSFQSTITGYDQYSFVGELEDGRLLFYYTVNSDQAYWDMHDGGMKPFDTEMSHINNLLLKISSGRSFEPAEEGIWETTLILEDSVQPVEADIEVVVPAYSNTANSFTATDIYIDALKVAINGKANENFDFKNFGMWGEERVPAAVMKDGSRVLADSKGTEGGIASSDITGEVSVVFYFHSVINPYDIQSIEWHGVTIWRAE